MSFNTIIIVGNLGRDPELTYTPSGVAVCKFSMATNERRGKGDDAQDKTTWFRVTVFGKQAESCSAHLSKGREVFVQGRLSADEWTDKDGKNRTSLEVTADSVKFIGGKGEAKSEGASASGDGAKSKAEDVSDDDIPF